LVIPVFNEASVLPQLLRSLDKLDADIVFVDGGSTDETRALISASGYRHVRARRGRAAQMNAGVAAARGNILLFLHADTRLPFGALSAVRNAIRDGAVGGSFDVALESRRLLLRLVGTLITLRSRLTGVSSGDQAIFVKREAFDRLGGFAPLALFEDLDFSRRLKRLGPVARLRPAVLTSPRRWEHGGALRTILRMWMLRALYYCGVDSTLLERHYEVAR
jgi:rSAM/selenodomain-associated transferase 2